MFHKSGNAWARGVAAVALVAGFVAAPQAANALDKVTLAYSSPLGVNFADVMFGRQLGLFEEQGIELDLISFQGAPVAVPQVAGKAVQFAFAEPSYLMAALDKGEMPPVRYVYNYYRSTTNDFAVLADSDIEDFDDFKGKTIGIGSMGWSGHLSMMRKVLGDHDIAFDKDVEVVAIGIGPAAWRQLETGAVDIAALYGSQDVQMEQAGMKIRRISYPPKTRAVIGLGMLAHEDTIANNPDLVARMGRALAQSTVACAAAREACARALWSFDATAKPEEDKQAAWVENGVVTLTENYKTATYFPEGGKAWGSFPEGVLDTFRDALFESDLISKGDLDVSVLYTNEFVDKFGGFDEAAIEARALKADADYKNQK